MDAVEATLLRPDLTEETKSWLKQKYEADIDTSKLGGYKFVQDVWKDYVNEGEEVVFVNDPKSGRKLQISVCLHKTTVGQLRRKIFVCMKRKLHQAEGDGFELDGFRNDNDISWVRDGKLFCGCYALSDDSKVLSEYKVQDESVISVVNGSITSDGDQFLSSMFTTVTDPDLTYELGRKISDLQFSLRHSWRGPGGVTGNG
ncbi:hypothetical protein GUITHDRAFT_165355, partial [Guillardia theta CCMP2712]